MRLEWKYDKNKHELSFSITPESKAERALLEMSDCKTPLTHVTDGGELVTTVDLRTDH